MRIAISGLSGCGITTACANVSKALGLKVVNYTFRDLAREMGITLEDLQERAKKDASYDYLVDKRQIELAEREADCIVGTRLAGWVIDNVDLRVWLSASDETRAKRIAKREGKSPGDVLAYTKQRDAENAERYKRYYGIDVSDLEGFDLVVNTEYLTAEQVAALIAAAAKLASENNFQKPSKIVHHVKQIIDEKLKPRLQKVSIEKGG